MFTAVRRLSPGEALSVEAPALLGALVVAEMWYKFHSFTLEAVAFLLTWFALGGLLVVGRKLIAPRPDST
jgi:hypothetical protein